MTTRNPDCPHRPQATACAQGELSPAEAAAFEAHARTCAVCAAEERSVRALLADLKALPAREPARDLVGPVLAAIAAPAPARRRWWPAACAAALLVAALGGWWLRASPDPRLAAIRRAGEWLAGAQLADGRWTGAGQDRYDPALTGLGLLAGLELPPSGPLRDACGRAAAWLADQQAADGRLGPAFDGSPYNQGIGTLALLRWGEAFPKEERIRVAAGRAVRRIVESQGESGGWGYASGDPSPNVSITIWQLQALRKAETLGMAEAVPALRRGLRWLRTTRNGQGLYGYRKPDDYPEGPEALTAMSVFCELACDGKAAQREDVRRSLGEVLRGTASGRPPGSYYAAYFIARVLHEAKGEQTERLLDRVQQALLARQVGSGDARGSWDPADAYFEVGGPVYATTMAVLALKE